MLEKTFDTLRTLQSELNSESCLPKEPFIKLGSGQAPTLNYNIPQEASFQTYGNQIVKGIEESAFKAFTKIAPENNYFDRVKTLDKDTLKQKFAEAVQLQRSDENLIANVALLRKHLDLSQSNLKAVSLKQNVDAMPGQIPVGVNGAAPLETPLIVENTNQVNEIQLANLAAEGVQPILIEKLGGYQTKMKFLKQPKTVVPYFAIIEEYTTSSFLGDYGAGKTLDVFSLLPNEKTTIAIKTFKNSTSTKAYAENVLDSFGENSANELEKNIEDETGSSNSDTSGSSQTNSNSRSANVSASIGGSFLGIVKFGVKGGYNTASANSATNSNSNTRASNVRSLNKALDRHVASSNSNRQVNVNSSTTETVTEGEEASTIRELVNLNKSRVLNFVFRQLLQQYVTITYLSNVRIVYCNGYYESIRMVDVEELENLLEDTINPEQIEAVRKKILKYYCNIYNHKDQPINFIEKVTQNLGACLGATTETEIFWRIKKTVTDSYTAGGLTLTVPGPILNVKTYTLQTASVVADALLGQGEALDCFNNKAQDAAVIAENLKNLEMLQRMEVLEELKDPTTKANLYKKIFGACCETPQTQIIH
jgi:hypothetical protein